MRKIYLFFMSILLLTALVACGPSSSEATTTPERTEPEGEEGDVIPRPTITPVSGSEEEEPMPETTTVPEEYPPPVAPAAQPEAVYPGDEETVWILLPMGVQCEGDGPYSTLEEAVLALDEAGVIAVDQATIELPVAQACGQPSSEHFRVQILAAGLPQAESLDWHLENE
jgi:hypothetical protein